MKNFFTLKKTYNTFFIMLFLLISFLTTAQVVKPFKPRFDKKVEGDMTIIANSILNRGDYQEKHQWGWWWWQWEWKYYYHKDPYNAPYSGSEKNFANNDSYMRYIDKDNDNSTFSSSSAKLTLPDKNYSKIIYAGLYWSARYNKSDFDKIKVKVPGRDYVGIQGDKIYDGRNEYACYADITKYVTALNDPSGDYFVANIKADQGYDKAAGWTIFFVYENPDLPNKYITSFDGFAAVSSRQGHTDIPFSGFKTIPKGPVKAKLASSALEGDLLYSGDQLQFKGGKRSRFTPLSSSLRPADNFFNGRITILGKEYLDRNLASRNTLGYDADITDITGLMDNNETKASLRLTSSGDEYYMFFGAFSVEIIEPRIYVVKTVENSAQRPIGSAKITPGQDLYYTFTFWNKGNDGADHFKIEDKLPANIQFTDNKNNLVLPYKNIKYSYNKNTHTIRFDVPYNLVSKESAKYTIKMRVRVADCNSFRDACSYKVSNQAVYSYRGVINQETISGQKSFSDFNNLKIPLFTNFEVDIKKCKFEQRVELCKDNVPLEAGKGYASYIWKNSQGKEVGRGAIYKATVPGVYTVTCQGPAGCSGMTEKFTVTPFGPTFENPLKPFGKILKCPDTGEDLAEIILCGNNGEKKITTNISGAASIEWEKLNESSCNAGSNQNCPNKDPKCRWNNVGKGPNFTIKDKGQYRMRIKYSGGCSKPPYYFNVYKNTLNFSIRKKDIVCKELGEIKVTGLGQGYEFSLNDPKGPYQNNPIFPIKTSGEYTVYVKQTAAGDQGCIFEESGIVILDRNITLDIKNVNTGCANSAGGSVRVQVNGGKSQYVYSLYRIEAGGKETLMRQSGMEQLNDYTFTGLVYGGPHRIHVTSENGKCEESENIDLVIPEPLKVTKDILPISCEDGKITLKVTGGVQPYYYSVNGGEKSMDPVIPVKISGTYNIVIEDVNGCKVQEIATVGKLDKPTYKVEHTDLNCNGGIGTKGSIRIVNIDAKKYELTYSIDTTKFQHSPVFTDLSKGTYTLTVRYAFQDRISCEETQEITIKESEPISASIVIVEDPACDPTGQNRAKVRITNPSGGTAPYTYSINGSKFTNNQERYLPAGSKDVPAAVKDSKGCIFNMSTSINPVPEAPVITTAYEYFCSGDVHVTLKSAIPDYDYNYTLVSQDGTVTIGPQSSNVFKNVPPGSYTVLSKYKSADLVKSNILLKDDFGQGKDIPIPEIKGYKFIDQDLDINYEHGLNDGEYTVTKKLRWPQFLWLKNILDHTRNTNGRMLIVNVGDRSSDNLIYEKVIKNIIPDQDLDISLWGLNLFLPTHAGDADPNVTIELVSVKNNKVIATKNTGNIKRTGNWNLIAFKLNPGNNNQLYLRIRTMSSATAGNDLGIDDIEVKQKSIICDYKVESTVIIEDKKESLTPSLVSKTDISCFGNKDGKAVIQAANFTPYQYSLDKGISWKDAVLDTDSRFVIDNLSGGDHSILVRSSVNSASPCDHQIKVTIAQPEALQLVVKEQKFTNCNVVRVVLESKGGSGQNSYVLKLPDGTELFAQTGSVFEGLTMPGKYTATVTDNNECTAIVTFDLIVSSPVVATIDAVSDLCYTDTKKAVIVFNVIGGTAPYQYSLDNGGTWSSVTSSPKFEIKQLLPGTYHILVRDHLGCTTTVSQVIGEQLKTSAVLEKVLDCTVNPEAVIKLTVEGGITPIKYQAYKDGKVIGSLVDFKFMGSKDLDFKTSDPGTYYFEITDANGCSVQTREVVVKPLVPVSFKAVSGPIINCHGSLDGSIIITDVTGVPSYTTEIINTDTNSSYGNQTTGLPAGNYTVTVIGGNSCSHSETVKIEQKEPVDFRTKEENILCDATGTIPNIKGKITVEGVKGGTLPYTYILRDQANEIRQKEESNGADYTFDILEFGFYNVEVIDSNSCSKIVEKIRIASPPGELKVTVDPADPNCGVPGSATVRANGDLLGDGPFFFAVYRDKDINYPDPAYQAADAEGDGLSSTFKNLIPGVTYSFIVYDAATRCYHYDTAEMPIPTGSTLVSTIDPKNISCTGAADGKISFTFDKYQLGTISVDYEVYSFLSNLSTGLTGNRVVSGGLEKVENLGPITPGKYYILFTEKTADGKNGCTQVSKDFEISEATRLLTISAKVTKNANCNELGHITVTASAGANSYTYFIQEKEGAVSPEADDPNWVSSSVFRKNGGDYIVYVKDAYNCIKSTDITLPKDPLPEIKAVLVDACPVQGTYSIAVERIDIAGSVGPYIYSLNNGAFETKPDKFTYDNLNSGVHTIVIKDYNGCEFPVTVRVYDPLELDKDRIVQPTCAGKDGVIQVKGSGGSGNYEYLLKDDSGRDVAGPIAQTEFKGLASGKYVVVIRDTDTKCIKEYAFTLEQPSPVIFVLESTPVTCFGATDGTITVKLDKSNINPPYKYSLDGGNNVQDSNVFLGLSAGSYTVKVISERGCEKEQKIKVSGPDIIAIADVAVQQFGCITGNNFNNAVVTVKLSDISGGNGKYTFKLTDDTGVDVPFLNPTEVSWIITNKAGGAYIFTVYDSNNCSASKEVIINPFYTLVSATAQMKENISCVNNGESVEIVVMTSESTTVPADPDDFQYSKDAGKTWQDSNGFTELSVGIHYFRIKAKATGCNLNISHTVAEPNDIVLIWKKLNDVICFGTETGKVTFSIDSDSYSGAFNWEIYKVGATVPEKSGAYTKGDAKPESYLKAGTYRLVVRQQYLPECSKEQEFDILEPEAALVLTLEETLNVTCDLDKGQITTTAAGGWDDYSYRLVNKTTGAVISDFSEQYVFEGLTSAVYEVTVKDKKDCSVTETIELKAPVPIKGDITADKMDLSCFGAKDATINVNATGGSGDYSYIIHYDDGTISGPQENGAFPNLGAGKYYVTITDIWRCEGKTDTIEIKEPEVVSARINVNQKLTCKKPAKLEIIAQGGTAPYEYSKDGTKFLPLTPGLLFDAGVGVHTYYVRDTNGCGPVQADIEIEEIPEFIVTLDVLKDFAGCSADSKEAEISAEAEGGLGDYKYELLDETGAVVKPSQSSAFFHGIGGGKYTVRVTSADCTVISEEVIIAAPKPLIVDTIAQNVACHGTADGKITVNVTGGSGQYQYAISPDLDKFSSENSFDRLKAGTYKIIIQDEETPCYESVEVVIVEPTLLKVKEKEVIQELCEGDGGSITITVTGGTAPYYTSLDNVNYTEGKFNFPDLEGGKWYRIYVKDANNCQVIPPMSIWLNEPVDLQPKLTVEPKCHNNVPTNTVTVSINPAIDASKVTYALDKGADQLDSVFTEIEAGDHIIYVRHKNGCIKELKFKTDNQPIVIDKVTSENINCGGELQGVINIAASGGTGALEYAISTNPTTFQTSPRFENLAAGTYKVYVRDDIGCTAYATTTITELPSSEIMVKNKIIETCYGEKNGKFEIEISKGTPPYATSINSTATTDFLPNRIKFENLTSGVVYTIYVKDANNCITTHQVDMPKAIDLNPVATVTYNCDVNQTTNQVTISVNSEAEDDVLYSLNNGKSQLSNIFNNLHPGTYTVTVMHKDGCDKETKPFEIVAVAPLDLSVALGDLNEIVATIRGGVAPYRYYFNGKDNGKHNIYKVKTTGMYTVKVVDAVGCEVSREIYAEFFDIEIPNFFTPNNDGHNDTWGPKKVQKFPAIKIYIFDRYGREVKVLRLGQSWDGKYKGIPLSSGDYWYVIKLNGDDDKRKFVGNITLYR